MSRGDKTGVTYTMQRFDSTRATRMQRFFEELLTHTKGRFARKPFLLEPWQKNGIIRPLFGNTTYDDQLDEYVRQYRIAWLELGRKNGKSELLAGLALGLLCADDEESAEVYGAACDRDQATLVYQVAKRMVELSPVLSKRLTIIDSKKRIVDERTASFYQVIAADAGGNLGQNPHGIVFDEVLTQPNRELWDALKTGMGARAQPLMIAATTAGNSGDKFCLEEHDYSARLEESRSRGEDFDPARFVFLRNCPRDWDWQVEGEPPSEENPEGTGWYYANPALGSFLNINTLRAEAQEAAQKPQAQNAFRQFRLNQWVSQSTRWLDMGLWDENGTKTFSGDDLAGMDCFGGLDLASTSDFTAWILFFPTDEGYFVLPRFWLPRAALARKGSMQTAYQLWETQGFLTVTDGETVDYDLIESQIKRDAETFRIKMFGYDPWNATQVVGHLEDGGLTGVKVPQTTVRLNGPSKEIERALGKRVLWHGNNPVLRYMADNVEATSDGEGNVKPSRKKSTDKIDGILALCNAIFASMIREPEQPAPRVFSLADYID